VEETFRDVKNPRFGLGLKQAVIERNDRRDALFLLAVLAHTLLTLLGKAGQELGMSRMLGATRRRRTAASGDRGSQALVENQAEASSSPVQQEALGHRGNQQADNTPAFHGEYSPPGSVTQRIIAATHLVGLAWSG
jgi:hypothetical protein